MVTAEPATCGMSQVACPGSPSWREERKEEEVGKEEGKGEEREVEQRGGEGRGAGAEQGLAQQCSGTPCSQAPGPALLCFPLSRCENEAQTG